MTLLDDDNYLAYINETTELTEVVKGKNGAINVNIVGGSSGGGGSGSGNVVVTSGNVNIIDKYLTQDVELVELVDVGVDYTSGSVGQVKRVTEYNTYTPSKTKITTYKYAFSGNSVVIPSNITVTSGMV